MRRTCWPSRDEVRLGCCLGSGAVSFPLRGEEYCVLPLSTFEVNIKKKWMIIYHRNGCEKGRFLLPALLC